MKRFSIFFFFFVILARRDLESFDLFFNFALYFFFAILISLSQTILVLSGSFRSKLKNKRKIRRTNCLSECKAKGIQYKKCNKQCSRKALHKIDMETRWNNLILH